MKPERKHLIQALLLSGAVALIAPAAAVAAGTPACTPINNTAALSYSVGGTPQTGIPSTTASFTVGNKILFSVQNQDAANTVSVSPSDTTKLLTFLITNSGNANQIFALSLPAAAQAPGQTIGANTDNFDATAPTMKIGAGVVTATPVLIPGGTATVTISATIPAGQVDGDAAVYALLAQAYKVDGTTAETQSNSSVTSPFGTCVADIVFADTTAGSDDIARDGKDSARAAFKVSSAQLTFGKVATTIWDPINGNSGQKAIPGALIQYVFTITNAGTATSSATLTAVTDTLAATLAIDPDLKVPAACGAPPCALAGLANGSGVAGKGFKVDTTGAANTRASKTTPLYFTTANDADGVEHNAGAITATMGTALPVEAGYTAGQLKPGESVILTFNAVVQ